jgi:dolichol-phosphate mannosyltransferase
LSRSDPVLVIVPTYQERANIEEAINRLFGAVDERVHLLVIDDGSPDGTAEAARTAARHTGRTEIIERAGKQGLASAYIAGFRWALERGYATVVEMDADLSHDPSVVPDLVAALEDTDLVIGSRYVAGGRVVNWSLFRRLLSRGGNLYARLWLGWTVRDSTSGFRAYRCSALAAQDLGTVHSEGYAFQMEMTSRVHFGGGRITEVPITFTERRAGKSKLSRGVVVEALWRVPVWALKNRWRPGRGATRPR